METYTYEQAKAILDKAPKQANGKPDPVAMMKNGYTQAQVFALGQAFAKGPETKPSATQEALKGKSVDEAADSARAAAAKPPAPVKADARGYPTTDPAKAAPAIVPSTAATENAKGYPATVPAPVMAPVPENTEGFPATVAGAPKRFPGFVKEDLRGFPTTDAEGSPAPHAEDARGYPASVMPSVEKMLSAALGPVATAAKPEMKTVPDVTVPTTPLTAIAPTPPRVDKPKMPIPMESPTVPGPFPEARKGPDEADIERVKKFFMEAAPFPRKIDGTDGVIAPPALSAEAPAPLPEIPAKDGRPDVKQILAVLGRLGLGVTDILNAVNLGKAGVTDPTKMAYRIRREDEAALAAQNAAREEAANERAFRESLMGKEYALRGEEAAAAGERETAAQERTIAAEDARLQKQLDATVAAADKDAAAQAARDARLQEFQLATIAEAQKFEAANQGSAQAHEMAKLWTLQKYDEENAKIADERQRALMALGVDADAAAARAKAEADERMAALQHQYNLAEISASGEAEKRAKEAPVGSWTDFLAQLQGVSGLMGGQ